jgi:NAD(P)-dependent dehydrogenase (short-subunit alcohol dehydrogenase family)
MSSLDGKVALVTGAASKRGMGHAIALRLAREGANVVVADKIAAPKSLFPGDEGWGGLEEEVKEIKALGRDGMAVLLDISVGQEVDKAVGSILKKFGKIDILVHAAATRGPVGVPIVDLPEEVIRDVINVDLVGSFLITKAVAKAMVARGEGGKMVIFCSLAGTQGVAGSGSYCAAKWGAIGLTKTLALELAKYKINVNAINPGMIITNLRDQAFAKIAQEQGIPFEQARDNDYAMVSKKIPLGRMGTAEEIADLTYFLVSDQSRYMTGEAIALGGGVV